MSCPRNRKQWPPIIVMIALAIGGAVACQRPPEQALCSNPACAPDLVAVAALKGLRELRSQAFGGDSITVVASSVHWFPLVSVQGAISPPIGPVPFTVVALAEGAGVHIRLVEVDSALRARETVEGGVPIMILGPPDFLEENRAILRVNLYIHPNAQELYRVICVLDSDGHWRATALDVEWQA